LKGNRSVSSTPSHVTALKGGRGAVAAAKPDLGISRANPTAARGGLIAAWTRFWFTPTDPIGLNALRFLAGLVFLSWLLPLAGHYGALFGLQGWFDLEAFLEASRQQGGAPVPIIPVSLFYWCGGDPTLLATVYWGSIGVLVLFTLGLWPRLTAILTFAVVVSFQANPALRDDADALLGIVAFYLMIGYVLLGQWGRPLSRLERVLGPHDTFLFGLFRRRSADAPPAPPSYAANLAVRLLQIHFAIVLVVSGLHKLQFGDWWAGVAWWYPLHPPFRTTAESLLAKAAYADAYLFGLSLLQYIALAWQLGFPFFAWRKAWRPVLLVGGALAWLGCHFIYQQPLFGPLLMFACLSYLDADAWRWLADQLRQAVGRLTGGARRAEEDKVKVAARA
jgi:hypothetical protein